MPTVRGLSVRSGQTSDEGITRPSASVADHVSDMMSVTWADCRTTKNNTERRRRRERFRDMVF